MYVNFNVNSGGISGGISGAIFDINSNEAITHAEKYYGFIRSIDYDVERISINTGFSIEQINMVKNYIFYDKHNLDIGYERFEPDFCMAQSWRRLAFEPENILPHDIMLIKHELYEMIFIAQGIPYREAHIKSCKDGYDYPTMCKEYYTMLKKKKENKNKQVNMLKYSKDRNDIDDFER